MYRPIYIFSVRLIINVIRVLFILFSELCLKKKCGYYLNLDSTAHVDDPHMLKLLIEQNRPVVAPMMIRYVFEKKSIFVLLVKIPALNSVSRPYQAWSNFWGSLTTDGFYARSIDYMEIVQGQRRLVTNHTYIRCRSFQFDN